MNTWSATTDADSETLCDLILGGPDGIAVVDLHGIVVFANPAAIRMLRPEGTPLVGGRFGYPLPRADLTEIEVPPTGLVVEPKVSRLLWKGRPAWRVVLRDVTNRRRAAEAPVFGTAWLAQTERMAGLGSWEYDLASGRSTCSPGTARIIGRSQEELYANPDLFAEAVHPDDRERWWRALDATHQGRPVSEIEYRQLRPDGEARIIRAFTEPVLDADGGLVKLRGIVRDVTDERRAEQESRETVRWLKAIADHTVAVITVKDRDGRILFGNAHLERLTGRSRKELATLTAADLWDAATAELIRDLDARVLATGIAGTHEATFEMPDGQAVTWLSTVFPIPGETGRPRAIGSVSVDVTEQRRSVEALLKSEERFRLLAERSRDVIFRCRLLPRREIEYISPAAERILGIPAGEFTGDLRQKLTMPHPEDRTRLDLHWASLDPEPIVVRCLRPDGSMVWIEEHLTAVRDDSGQVALVEGNLRDVTARMTAEHEQQRLAGQLGQMERLESLGRLAGGVAHDFNNLLAVIVGTAEFLAEDLGVDDPRRADVERITHAAQRGAALTRQLLIFSRTERSRPEVLDVNEVVGKIEDMLRRTIGADIDFGCRLSPAPVLVKMDRAKLEQIVLNLVVNARSAMPEGGRLTVRTDYLRTGAEDLRPAVAGNRASPDTPPAPVGGVSAGGAPAGGHVRLTVADTGCGMPPDVVRRAFEPFFTTREPGQGSGLGLSTVHGIVREVGGHITIDSRPGEGTTFRVHLPATAERLDAEAASDDLPQGAGEIVLVVEDEDPVREVVMRTLERNGYRVVGARDPAEALELCANPGIPIDLLLTDLIMPGMSGVHLADRVNAETRPGLPVLFMSGYAPGLPTGPGILDKPFNATVALHRIRETLDQLRRS